MYGNSISDWVVFNEDRSKVRYHHSQACHDQMVYSSEANCDMMFTGMPNTDDLSRKFIDYLIRRPYNSMSDLITVEQSDSGKMFIRCSQLDKWPANVLFNFCIASRIPIEFRFQLERWQRWMEMGFDESLALILAFKFGHVGINQTLDPPSTFSQHLPFDTTLCWSSFIKGEMSKISPHSYKDKPSACSPGNVIWGKSPPDERESTLGKTPLELAEIFQPFTKDFNVKETAEVL
ncbi:MAG: hypothetical protein B7Z80_02700 [Rhodospirillales bacterium 20-64-7]|nr:MAG: hypothetical protein B7Z80_02700 [Rhodospirillales bacterium 20-64-7]